MPTARASAALLTAPPLFADGNVLRIRSAVGDNDHIRLRMDIGTRGSHVAPQSEFLSLDSYSYLVEGEREWFLAPPSCAVEFRRLLVDRAPLDVDPSVYAEFVALGVYAVRQRQGDAVFIPGGWVHTSQSVAASVSFGSVFLRARSLHRAVDWAATRSEHNIQKSINLSAIVDLALSRKWALTAAERELLVQRVQQLWAINDTRCEQPE
jgi:hypothetical protein